MAKKKIPSVDDAIKIFKDVMLRASLSDYLYVNNMLISKNQKGTILVIPDNELWLKLLDDPEIKEHLQELDISIPEHYEKSQLMVYGEDLENESWVETDSEILYKGKIFKINIKGFEYEVPINRDLLPLKLKKAEYNNISYRVFIKPNVTLVLKKRFNFPDIEECGFTIVRMFKII